MKISSLFANAIFLSVFGPIAAVASDSSAAPVTPPKTLLEEGYPFVPYETDYALELGVFEAKDPNVWAGALIGRNLGRCIFTESETCQQYLDLIGGAAVREGETYGMVLISPRWQYVNFPDRASPFWRVFAGVSPVNRPGERSMKAMGGVGIGVTTYLHQYVDLRFELRAGEIDQAFMLGLISAHIKTDRLLEYFAVKLKELGIGTVKTAIEATGTALKATGEGVGGVIESVSGKSSNKARPPPPAK